METFTPPRPPQIGSGDKVTFKVIEVPFGDGYGQAAGDGLNSKRTDWSLVWNGLLPAEVTDIKAFLDARGGHETFLWTPTGEAVARKFKCRGYQRGDASEESDQFTATFKEVYEL